MSGLSRSWKKVKSSGAFHRRVKKNLREILNSNSPKIHSNLLTLSSDSQINNEPSTVDDAHQVPQSETYLNNFVDENREKWLVELEDDNDTSESKYIEEDINDKFRNDLKHWANTFNMTHRSLKELMKIINDRWPKMVPQDPRTFLETPSTIILQKIGDGFYWHQGLDFCLKMIPECLKISNISLNVNIDGLPLYKSSKD